jgi:regulator of protease activity HflC (stomatin/prohibitin superfamily)
LITQKQQYSALMQAPSGSHTPHPIQVVFSFLGVVATVAAFAIVITGMGTVFNPIGLWPAVLTAFLAFFLTSGLRVASAWEKAVVLRFGKFKKTHSQGIFWVMPFVDQVTQWVDQRVQTTTINSEQTLTKDTVPVDVDAVLFWHVWDAEKAVLEVNDYQRAIFYKSQTNLRDVIGETMLSELLVGRKQIGDRLQVMIDKETEPWGITVQSVEVRDISIPSGLQDAMSRQAQAERERQARVILGDAERQVADSFIEAGKMYEENPMALHLRAMNMLYEGLKEKGALIVVPSSAVETMGLGGIMGLQAAAKGMMRPQATAPNKGE